MKLLTIICEALARAPVLELLEGVGAHGYTLFPVEGTGSQGERPADIAEFGNIQIEVLVPVEVAEKIWTALEKDYFPRYAMIAYEADVRVLRHNKF